MSLYELLDIWGYSYDSWTPLALSFRALCVDEEIENPSEFKGCFRSGDDETLVGEFLYVQGGVHDGNWNWGMVGRVNGALLWRESFAYLTDALGRQLLGGTA